MKDKNEDIVNLPRHFYSKIPKKEKSEGKRTGEGPIEKGRQKYQIGLGKPGCRSRAE